VSYYTQDHDTICAGECIQYRDSSRYLVDSWYWQFGAGSPATYSGEHPPPICYPTPGHYTSQLRVHSRYGIDSMQRSIYVRPCESCIGLPNAFSPNGDNNNDTYLVWTACSVASYTIRIYNRWGELVYEGHDLHTGWDGSYRGEPQPAGLYQGYVSATHYDGSIEQRRQFITLIR
jgi:gliding motility-associated-like protein